MSPGLRGRPKIMSDKLPALRLSDGEVLIHSKAILAWVNRQGASVSPR